MPFITRDLLRKRAEHNEGILSTLEEVSLHQEELENINEVLGQTCRKLKILYLQNNIIPKMENLYHFKELRYLNLALNNIEKIDGLHNCEFLTKLDLTINFIDYDTLEESITHLIPLYNLHDIYFMGNPAQVNWTDFNAYVIAKLPQLVSLDGTEITKSMRILAQQKLPTLEKELRELATAKRLEKETKRLKNSPDKLKSAPNTTTSSMDSQSIIKKDNNNNSNNDNADDEEVVSGYDEMTENTPETRVKIYKELAEQKRIKEEKRRVNEPRERDEINEHQTQVKSTRTIEETLGESDLKQKNEGGWAFHWDEDTQPGYLLLEIKLSVFLDTSLIDVDLHPTYLSMIIKSKLLRLKLPCEISVGQSKCQRNKVTGSLLIIMKKINSKDITFLQVNRSKSVQSSSSSTTSTTTNAAAAAAADGMNKLGTCNTNENNHNTNSNTTSSSNSGVSNETNKGRKAVEIRVKRKEKAVNIQDQLILEAISTTAIEKKIPSPSPPSN